mmetsp:Transcript_2932/g.7041  ORF Transcript_2932/g.7041 Transcript_2932/m.7041 type:complete len:430 (-) Transcript_2932:2116-3405(-)
MGPASSHLQHHVVSSRCQDLIVHLPLQLEVEWVGEEEQGDGEALGVPRLRLDAEEMGRGGGGGGVEADEEASQVVSARRRTKGDGHCAVGPDSPSSSCHHPPRAHEAACWLGEHGEEGGDVSSRKPRGDRHRPRLVPGGAGSGVRSLQLEPQLEAAARPVDAQVREGYDRSLPQDRRAAHEPRHAGGIVGEGDPDPEQVRCRVVASCVHGDQQRLGGEDLPHGLVLSRGAEPAEGRRGPGQDGDVDGGDVEGGGGEEEGVVASHPVDHQVGEVCDSPHGDGGRAVGAVEAQGGVLLLEDGIDYVSLRVPDPVASRVEEAEPRLHKEDLSSSPLRRLDQDGEGVPWTDADEEGSSSSLLQVHRSEAKVPSPRLRDCQVLEGSNGVASSCPVDEDGEGLTGQRLPGMQRKHRRPLLLADEEEVRTCERTDM